MSFDWKSIVGGIAPTIATALGGPLAGMAVKELSAGLLGHPDGKESDLATAIQTATPDTLLKIKQIDTAFKQKTIDAGIDLEKINAGDRASARNREINLKDRTPKLLAAVTVMGFFVVVGWVLTGKVSLDSTLLGFVLGQVSTKAEQVYNYYFGSSSGSDKKTQYLANKPPGSH